MEYVILIIARAFGMITAALGFALVLGIYDGVRRITRRNKHDNKE